MEYTIVVLAVLIVLVSILSVLLGYFIYIMNSRGWLSNWEIGIQIAADEFVEDFYRKPRNAFWQWRCKRAWQYLIKHDSVFRSREAGFEVVRRRDAFYAAGGDPASPKCPEREDVLKDWGFSK